MENLDLILWIIGIVISIIEIIMRAIPNEKAKGIVGYIIDILKVISDYLNNKGIPKSINK